MMFNHVQWNQHLVKEVSKTVYKRIKRYVFIFGLILLIACGYFYFKNIKMSENFLIRDAKARVNAIFEGIKLRSDEMGPEGNEHVAVSQWWANIMLISDIGTLSKASDDFDNWKKEGGIFPYIRDYTISEAILVKKEDPVTVEVSGTINGSDYTVRVPKGEQMTWIRTPFASQFDTYQNQDSN